MAPEIMGLQLDTNNLPLNRWRALEDLLDDWGIAGVSKGWQAGVDTEVVKS